LIREVPEESRPRRIEIGKPVASEADKNSSAKKTKKSGGKDSTETKAA